MSLRHTDYHRTINMITRLLLSVLCAVVHVTHSIEGLSSNTTLEEPNKCNVNNSLTVHTNILSRKKRYLIFPAGSSLQLYYCLTYPSYARMRVNMGITAGIAWMLPGEPDFFLEKIEEKKKKKHTGDQKMVNRRYKRYVFDKVQALFSAIVGNGRDCLLKTLCESGQRTTSKKSFILEFLYKLFSFTEVEYADAHPEDAHLHRAHRSVNQNCSSLFPACSISLFY